MKKIFLTAFLLLITPLSFAAGKSVAYFLTAGDLQSYCKPGYFPNQPSDPGMCYGYLEGAMDAISYGIAESKNINFGCLYNYYNGFSGRQFSQMLLKYLDNNLNLLNMAAFSVVMNVYEINFPTPKECQQ